MQVMQQQRLQRRYVLDADRRHASHHPPVEGVDGHYHAELKFRQLRTALGDQMGGRDNAEFLPRFMAVGFARDGLSLTAMINLTSSFHFITLLKAPYLTTWREDSVSG
jgi:hypothetical protein